MAEERGVVRRIVWRDVFPGILLFRCFRLAIGLPALILATAGTLLMPVGPFLLRTAAPRETRVAVPVPGPAPVIREFPLGQTQRLPRPPVLSGWLATTVGIPRFGVLDAFTELVQPYFNLFNRQARLGQLFQNLGVGLWYLLIWALLGGAITRMAVVRLGCGEQVSLRHAVRHAAANYGWYFSAPLFPLLGVAFTAVFLAILGAVMQANLGVLLAGFLWPLALIAGTIMAILVVGLFFGWPLMWPTIGAEEASDSFQAFSNSFSFTFQRPLQYLFYAVLAVILGGLGGLFVEAFVEILIGLTHWGLSFGLGNERLNQLLAGQLTETAWVGGYLIRLGNWLVRVIAIAYYFSFLFCAASAIYLLLRREVDQTDFDEVYMPESAASFSLPPLQTGPHGVPEMVEKPPTSTVDDRPSET